MPPAGPAARWRGAARTVTGAAATAACLLAATAAPPAAVYGAGHPSPASPARPARYRPAAGAATAPSLWIGIAAGTFHSCGIREGNTLWCWGYPADGALGTGATTDQDQPQQISRPTAGWTSVTAGYQDSCATRNDGTLWCWGDNDFGQLGIGNSTNMRRPHQVTTPAATGWATVTAGNDHICATRSDGTLWCWGANGIGQLGTGTTTNQDLPQQVTTPAATGWATVAGGFADTCATRSDGTLWCWGWNLYGQLGTGNTTNQDLPQQVTTPAATGWATVTAGNRYTCAARTDTTLWCWGYNGDGELGTGNTTNQDLPQQVTVPAATGWTSVTSGSADTACALRTHALRCWGANNHGELGIGTTGSSKDLPQRVLVPTPTGWSRLAPGFAHTCAIHTGPTLWCWGDNQHGDLGIGNTAQQDLPQQVTS